MTEGKGGTGWMTSSINCFDDWFRREDYGDRDQLERCWANAQNVAARDRNKSSDTEQLLSLRAAAEKALELIPKLLGQLDSRFNCGAIQDGEQVADALRHALGKD
jgi:hypothetical protein